jgi:hypothetical protein
LRRELCRYSFQATLFWAVARERKPFGSLSPKDDSHITVVWITRVVSRIVLKNADERRLHLSRRHLTHGEYKRGKQCNNKIPIAHDCPLEHDDVRLRSETFNSGLKGA